MPDWASFGAPTCSSRELAGVDTAKLAWSDGFGRGPAPFFLFSRISLDPVVAGLDLAARALSPIVFRSWRSTLRPRSPGGWGLY